MLMLLWNYSLELFSPGHQQRQPRQLVWSGHAPHQGIALGWLLLTSCQDELGLFSKCVVSNYKENDDFSPK